MSRDDSCLRCVRDALNYFGESKLRSLRGKRIFLPLTIGKSVEDRPTVRAGIFLLSCFFLFFVFISRKEIREILSSRFAIDGLVFLIKI